MGGRWIGQGRVTGENGDNCNRTAIKETCICLTPLSERAEGTVWCHTRSGDAFASACGTSGYVGSAGKSLTRWDPLEAV